MGLQVGSGGREWPVTQKIGVELPITAEVYRVLFEEKAPDAAVADLMGRELKRE